ncbi:hypothetical protein FOA52_005577 [Chlamydomonas sp. UWO 241]|nr:hypothetical protein FOA52_005577 [Chlamydomonas sp. UWO 241]
MKPPATMPSCMASALALASRGVHGGSMRSAAQLAAPQLPAAATTAARQACTAASPAAPVHQQQGASSSREAASRGPRSWAAEQQHQDQQRHLQQGWRGFAASAVPAHAASKRHTADAAADADAAAGTAQRGGGAAEAFDARAFRAQHDMTVEDDGGGSIPDPVTTFEGAGFPAPLLEVVMRAGYTAPSPIQAQAWPIAVAGRDLIGVASTGSGKTAAFIVPALMRIREAARAAAAAGANAPGPRGRVAPPTALVLAPTRELARQIEAEALKFGAPLGLRTTCLYGGAPRGGQLASLSHHPHMVVATPGRLIDFAEGGELDLSRISYLVLDEADRMLDMGFEPQLRQLLRYVPAARQTLFFSATWPKEVRVASEALANNRPVRLFIGDPYAEPKAAMSIVQTAQIVRQPTNKLPALVDFIGSLDKGARVIVFVQTKARCEWLLNMLSAASGASPPISACCLNGDLSQDQRDRSMRDFKSGRRTVLIATDVASRGLDVPNVAAVVNFDLPIDGAETYVHRIGRTGRAGASGLALSLLVEGDSLGAATIATVMRGAGQEPSAEVAALAARARGGPSRAPQFGGSRGGGGGGRGGSGGYGREHSTPRSNYGGGRGGGGGGGSSGGGGDWRSDRAPGRARQSGDFGGRDRSHGYGGTHRAEPRSGGGRGGGGSHEFDY